MKLISRHQQSRVAFVISLLPGKALTWATAEWDMTNPAMCGCPALHRRDEEGLQSSSMMHWIAYNSTFHSTIPEAADLAMAVVYSIFGVCSVLGNTMLLYVSYKKKQLLKPAEFFIINLAVSDLGMTLSLYPLAVTSSLYHRWLYGKVVCLLYAFCGVLFGICSLTTLTILSSVCCLKVCYPLYGNRFSPDHSCYLIAGAWAYALLFACSPLVHWGAYGPEPYGTACCIDWHRSNSEAVARSYTVVLFVCCYMVPCAVIIASYSLILVMVRESRKAVEQHVSAQTRMGNIQTVIVKLSVAVCIGFFAAWSPYALVSMWATYGHVQSIPPLAFAVPAIFAKSSTLYNPLVYLLLKPNFRHLLCKDLMSLQRRCLHHCLCRRCLRRLSLRSLPDIGLHSIRSQTDSTPFSAAAIGQAVLSSSHYTCERCQDTFECFKHYPRCCHGNVNTVHLSIQDNSTPVTPEGSRPVAVLMPGPGPPPKAHPASKRNVRVVVRDKKNIEIDSCEITLETVPNQTKTAATQ
ncbi:opsin 7, group member a [Polymixia lowei]